VRSEGQRFVTVRSSDGTWLPLTADVSYKILDDDGAMQSLLLRLGPGATVPAHDHADDEVCLVL